MVTAVILLTASILILLIVLIKIILKEYQRTYDNIQTINITGGIDINSGREKEAFQGFGGIDHGTVRVRKGSETNGHLVFLEDCASRTVYRCKLSNRRNPCIIGRRMDAKLHMNQIGIDNDIHISRQHCRLILYRNKIFLENMSRHGCTLLNGQPLLKPEPLHTGDYITIGNIRLRVIRIEKRR